ncbi:MAG TPA: hypothetical protein VGO53_07160, partial [Steroidobacteraceae bacterium]|nr:hypothetical protein [Steroidobacteraceae bacterium]
MRRYFKSLVVPVLLSAFVLLAQAHAAEVVVPRALEDWRGWVLHDEDYRRCPFMASSPAEDSGQFRCAWPERLSLTLDARGGTFSQRWQTFAESWVRIPGNIEHWPQDVRVDGARGAVVNRDGLPTLRLSPGMHAISGKLSWSTRPESVAVDARTAVVDLTLDGRRVTQPERPDGAVWLGKRRTAEQPARMEVQVYRLLQDSVPTLLVTRVRLQVSGDGREEILARVLPEGFTALRLQSPLPARLEPDGRLRVQVRAGSWDVDVSARGAGVVSRVARPPVGEGLWAREEVWSFQGEDRLRVASAQGPDGIDPAQANVPPEWRGYPAFRMAANSTLEITERSRGLQNADDNRLSLSRDLWLDFDHNGLTAVDHLSGTMRKNWRLEMGAPYSLQSASASGESLLVTRNPGGGPGAGLEVRSPSLALETVARTSKSRGEMPATGWNARFDQVSGRVYFPPGHRLLAAFGADRAPGAWVEQWGLWGLFGVLVVAVFSGWLAGWVVGVVAFVALLLTYQESPSYIWLWSNLLAALALARAAPEGRLRRFARGYRAVSFALLGVALLPLLWGQARLAIHPQLAAAGGVGRLVAPIEATLIEDSAAPAMPAAPPEQDVSEVTVTGQVRKRESELRFKPDLAKATNTPTLANPYGVGSGLNAAQVVQRYAPGTLVQAGPGIPAWSYVEYYYGWSGPVEAQQSVHFLYIGPVLLGLWRFVGAILLAALFAALLHSSDRGRWQWPDARDAIGRLFTRRVVSASGASAVAILGLSITLLLVSSFVPARAATPSAPSAPTNAAGSPPPGDSLLEELKARLTKPPGCTPTCAEITSAQVAVRGDRLDVVLEVSTLATVAVPVPAASDRWQLDAVIVDDRSALAVGREEDGTFSVPLTPGVHVVRLSGALAGAESISLEFPGSPRAISVSSEGWDVSGVNEGRLLSGSLEMVRRRTAAAGGAPLETASEFPAFVRVSRVFTLGLDWTVTTG